MHGHTPTQEGLPIRFDFSHHWLAWSALHGCDSSGTEGLLQEGKHAMMHSAVVACDDSTFMLRKQNKRREGGSYNDRTIYAAIE
jgi:hypothetical protein